MLILLFELIYFVFLVDLKCLYFMHLCYSVTIMYNLGLINFCPSTYGKNHDKPLKLENVFRIFLHFDQ